MYNQNQILKISVSSIPVQSPACSHLTTIIYNQYQLPLICDYLNYPLQLQDSHLLIQDPQNHDKYHIVIRICDVASQQEELSIEKLVALSDRILCVQLEKELQSKIQKMFISCMPQIYGSYRFTGGAVPSPQLCFVNQGYKKMYSRQAQGISYFKTLKQFTLQSPHHSPLRKSPSIPIPQLLSLYSHPSLTLKQIAQIKYSMLSYKQLMLIKTYKEETQRYILKEGIYDVNKSVLRDVSKNVLNKKDIGVLEWKYGCLKNFGDLIYEEKVNRGLVAKYKKSTLTTLSQQQLILEIKQFSSIWQTNTLAHLHKLFRSIVNRRDTKAITQYRNQYNKIYDILNECLLHCSQTTENYKKIGEVLNNIREYVGVCEDLIRDQYLAAFRYGKYMGKYVWRHQPKVYYKVGFFVMLVGLAWIMGNLVSGGLMVAGGLIFLAINI